MLDYASTGLRQAWRVDVLSAARQLQGTLDGAEKLSVSHRIGATIRGTGTVDVDVRHTGDLLGSLLRVWVDTTDPHTGQVDSRPLLTGIVELDSTTRATTSHTQQLRVKDRTALLDGIIGSSLAIPAGVHVTGRLRTILADLGDTAPAITESSAVTRTALYFEPGTTWRNVVSTLADTAGYAATWADELGTLQLHPYVPPASRPVVGELRHGQSATFRDEVTVERDVSSIPNHMVATSRTDGETEPLVSELWDTDPGSPWSTVVRGREVPLKVPDVDAADQATLDAHAQRAWVTARTATTAYTVEARWRPYRLGDRLALVTGPTPAPGPAGTPIVTTAVVENMSVDARAGYPLDDATIDLQEVTQ